MAGMGEIGGRTRAGVYYHSANTSDTS